MNTTFEEPRACICEEGASAPHPACPEHPGGVLAEIEHEDRPPGYGKLLETYEWFSHKVPGMPDQVRARCIQDDKMMTLTLKVDPRYGKTDDRKTRGDNQIVYAGRMVQAWECPDCKQWVTK